MTLAEHLVELRRRLLWSLIAFVAATVLAFAFYDPLYRFLTHPYCQLPVSRRLGGDHCTLIVTGIFDAFTIRLKVAAICGVILSAPFWLYQLWAFLAPGLHRSERRWALVFASFSVALFSVGAVFAYFTLGKGLAFLLSFAGDLTPLIAVDKYLSFVTTMLLVFGASFEFPLLVVLLNVAGILSARRLAGAWRAVIFAVFVFAAVATPSQDPITMSAMAVPMSLMYGVALLVASAHDRRKARREARSSYARLRDDEVSPLDLDDGSLT